MNNFYENPHLSEEPSQHLVDQNQWQIISSMSGMSARELEVCQLLFGGQTRSKVADQLGIKDRTARKYTEQIYEKLRVTTRSALVLRIIQMRDICENWSSKEASTPISKPAGTG